MPRARVLVLTGLGGLLAGGGGGLPLAPAVALAAQEAAQDCPAGEPLPHHVQRLAARFDDRGNRDPADDILEATLTLCGQVGARSAYEVSVDVRPPLFADADRDGDGQAGRKEFCAETRDAVVRHHAGPPKNQRPEDGGSDGVNSELVPGVGGVPHAIRFTGLVAALERVLGEELPRDGSRTVHVWAEARLRAAAAAAPYAHAPNRKAVDRLPAPDLSDGCARPQEEGEALAVTLTAPSPPACGGGPCTVFVINDIQGGGIGSLDQADGICQEAAADAGLGGTYKAWLSDDTASPSTRFTRAAQPYVLVNGARVAADWADLTDYSIDTPIIVDQSGQTLQGTTSVWTGTNPDGTATPRTCSNWTGTGTGVFGRAVAGGTGAVWSTAGVAACGQDPDPVAALAYCFQQ
jgi:hypothetical protein